MKSESEMINDSYERSEQQLLYSYDYDKNNMLVINRESHGEYLVTVDIDNELVIECECPHYQYRCRDKGVPCKHICFVMKQLGYNY